MAMTMSIRKMIIMIKSYMSINDDSENGNDQQVKEDNEDDNANNKDERSEDNDNKNCDDQ